MKRSRLSGLVRILVGVNLRLRRWLTGLPFRYRLDLPEAEPKAGREARPEEVT